MTMHLEGPWLSTTGKKKGKTKWKSAEHKRQAEQLAREWQAVLSKHKSTPIKNTSPMARPVPKLMPPVGRVDHSRIPSLNGGVDSGPALKAPNKIYTGTKVKGIGTMHKSNAVPIFSDEEAVEISRMRR